MGPDSVAGRGKMSLFYLLLLDDNNSAIACVPDGYGYRENLDTEEIKSCLKIPEGWEIIGLYTGKGFGGKTTHYDALDRSFSSFGFIIWKPNPQAKGGDQKESQA